MNDNKDIFISYKNDYLGNLFASRLRDNLCEAGYSVYYNPHEKTSSDFPEKLKNAVIACTDLILIVSPECLAQLMRFDPVDWIREEVLIAHQYNKNIVPILVGGAEFPKDISEIPESLQFLHKPDNISFPQEPEEYYSAPFDRLTNKFIKSKKNSRSQYKDVVNSNPNYSIKESIDSLLTEARTGSVSAMYELGMLYFYGSLSNDGQNVVRDYGEAVRWLKKVSESDSEFSGHADETLARIYYCGEMPEEGQSYEKAYQYHARSSASDARSASQRAFQQQLGLGCPFDFQKAVDYYKEIIAEGDDIARLELAKFYTSYGYFKEASEQYLAMTELSPEAAFNLGMLYKKGVLTDPPMPDYVNAQYFLGLAAETVPEAALEYALIFFRPTGKIIRKDFKIAQRYFKMAADGGLAEAQYMLGFMYEHGHVERDMEKAIGYFKQAASHGHSLAATELASLYQFESEERNYEKAYDYAVIAASHGVAEGAFILGNLLFWGRGCESDINRALKHYDFAFQHGIFAAGMMADKIRKELQDKQQ